MVSVSKQALTDCAHCHTLCLGPAILPCGHVTCRRCVRHILLEEGPGCVCPFCGHSIPRGPGQTTRELLDQMERDPVMDRLVSEKLARQGDVQCKNCPQRLAIRICEDCHSTLCDDCSNGHQDQPGNADHAVRGLFVRGVVTFTFSETDADQAVENHRREVSLLEQAEDHLILACDKLESSFQRAVRVIKEKETLIRSYSSHLPNTYNISKMATRLQRLRADSIPPSLADMLTTLESDSQKLAALWDVGNQQVPTGEPALVRLPPEYRLEVQTTEHVHVTNINTNTLVEVNVRKGHKKTESGVTAELRGPAAENSQKKTRLESVKAHSVIPINLDIGTICVDRITDDRITQAVEDVLMVKIDWAKELARAQELQTEKRRLDRQLQAERDRAVQSPEEARRKAEARLEELYLRHQEEKRRERQMVRTFVVKIEQELEQEKERLLRAVMESMGQQEVLQKLIQKLFNDFDVRLLGVDTGLRFLMDTPTEQWDRVQAQQQDIQITLTDALLPHTEGVTCSPVTPYELDSDNDVIDLRLDRSLSARGSGPGGVSVPDSSIGASVCDSTQDQVQINPMTATPCRVTKFFPRQVGDSKGPWITFIIATQDGRLVMADCKNKKVKTVDLRNPDTVLSITFESNPWGLALLHDGLVAVTLPWGKSLCLVDVIGQPSVMSRMRTTREYRGVSAGTTEDTLIVSCETDQDGPAAVDIVTKEGEVIRTVIDSNTLSDLSRARFLCLSQQNILGTTSAQAGPVTGQFERSVGGENVPYSDDAQNHLLISDLEADKVFCVGLDSGQHVSTLEHTDIKWPCQVATDQLGNIYIACRDGECVLVRSGEDGQYRRLLEGRQHGEGEYVLPRGLCITGSRLVVAWEESRGDSVVSVYELS